MNGSISATRRRLFRLNRWYGLLLLAVALLSPVLANDVPLMASVGGKWSFPAFVEYVGNSVPAPGDHGWKDWWANLPPDSGDWAVMPLWPYGAFETHTDELSKPPQFEHPFGTDDTGHDVLARLLHGTSTALGIALGSVLVAMLVGVLCGGLAGLCGGFVDAVMGRIVELFLCFPWITLVLVAAALFGSSVWGVIVVLGLAFWPSFARIVRGELLSLRERDYVACARGLGVGGWRLLRRHMLPQVRGPVLVTAAFCAAQAVVAESTLSFLGLGPGLRVSSWGSLLLQGRESVHFGWHLWVFPSLAIVSTIICCHTLADELRERRPA
jgi:peptide/nickel transport system permease protein